MKLESFLFQPFTAQISVLSPAVGIPEYGIGLYDQLLKPSDGFLKPSPNWTFPRLPSSPPFLGRGKGAPSSLRLQLEMPIILPM